ncbi:uncharacterized protein KY384_002715 [Bacidia gigantensis]|uniref:uncharacterized protein n=1 Tax=Bacidia gigantensis TaxID=2732470 RepID=UPI001D05A4DD|nr:uncharacterized protein KY384_002715 [Bacidia gigantensis]KAG8532837.1 hypothetical protein KY384_002715 [Bacidia gigantensis]
MLTKFIDSTRRSGRATKGQHRGFDEAKPSVPKKSGGRGKKKHEPEPEEEEEDAIIRCVCGATTEDEDDERTMICCENCEAWQHNECMEVSSKDDELPDQYYCEQCRPQDHKSLLAKIERGEKPWEERARAREIEEEERLARKKGRPSMAKKEELKTNGAVDHEDSIMTEADVPAPIQDADPPSPHLTNNKRKLPNEATLNSRSPSQSEPANKIRKASSPPKETKPVAPAPERRKSSNRAESKRESIAGEYQANLVERIDELKSAERQRVANALQKLFDGSVKQAQKDKTFSLAKGQSEREYALKLALSVEYAMFLNLFGTAIKPSDAYADKFRALNHNVKANPTLRDQILRGELSPNDLSKLSREDMASKELQEKKAEMVKEAEKQHMLIQEEGPRIRRTHKGEELVDNDTHMADASDTAFSAPIRKRPSDIDTNVKNPSPEPPTAVSPEPVELPEHVGEPEVEAKPPLKIDTQEQPQPAAADLKSSATFNIQDVWSGVKGPDPEQRARRSSKPSESVAPPTKQQPDAEIDRLLKDEEPEDEEPYSPVDYSTDPNAPIWLGRMGMPNIATFSGRGNHAAGANLSSSIPWSQLLPPTMTIEGRIHTAKADEYLCGLRFSNSAELTVVSVTSNDAAEDQAQFEKLFKYFTERQRYGVISKNPVSNVKDTYVVPLEAGTEKKPEFLELLDDCKIEFPSSERMLLLSFVIRMNNSPSAAQQTPRAPEVTTLQSPVTATGHPPGPIGGHPGVQHTPPVNLPYQPPPPPYSTVAGSPSQGQGAYVPPQQSPSYDPRGMEAARMALGELVAAPAIAELLQEAPNAGLFELGIVRQLLESVPASRTNFPMLQGMLMQKLQEQQQQAQQQGTVV